MTLRVAILLVAYLLTCRTGHGQIKISPNRVNVNANGATTVFLTCGGVVGYRAGEALWCGAIMSAAPDIGFKPVPGTVYGSLPARFDQSTFSGNTGFTAIMSIPPSVARRAYQAAAGGARPVFYFVCRFISLTGGRDVYVPVTCELSGGGARTPFALTDVELLFEGQQVLPSVREGGEVPRFSATIVYTGTGQLQGRWEIVRPGDEPPSEHDLLTEATLPIEQRAKQRRYTQLERFSVFLPPTGTFTLPGPDPSLLPSSVSGLYMVLLRIETSPDAESVSDLQEVGAGPAPVSTGGAAGFAIPPLRYFVGGGQQVRARAIALLLPRDMASAAAGKPVDLSWREIHGASLYRVVVIDPSNIIVLTALLRPGPGRYRLPPWVWKKTEATNVLWSVEALDEQHEVVSKSEWRTIWRQ